MKTISVIGMIVGTVFIGMVIITGFTDPFTEFLDQATYLVGGLCYSSFLHYCGLYRI